LQGHQQAEQNPENDVDESEYLFDPIHKTKILFPPFTCLWIPRMPYVNLPNGAFMPPVLWRKQSRHRPIQLQQQYIALCFHVPDGFFCLNEWQICKGFLLSQLNVNKHQKRQNENNGKPTPQLVHPQCF
jgi:hypothetical protein